MPSSWKNRSTYGKLLKRIIIKQTERFDKCDDDETAIKIAANIGYLIEKLNSILKIVEIEDAERNMGLAHAEASEKWGMTM